MGIFIKARRDYDVALLSYTGASETEANIAGKKVGDALNQVYQNLRTISFLPSVRNIDRHGTNLDENARQSIQQIYNNLASNVAMSEVYIVPIDLNPDKIDPVTGEHEIPILMFDALNFDPNKPQPPEVDRDPSLPIEEEVDEYRQFHELGQWLKTAYPNNNGLDALQTPMFAGEPVITCDNSEYDTSRVDEDRKGVMFTVPFFASNGVIKGMIAGVIRIMRYAIFYLQQTMLW